MTYTPPPLTPYLLATLRASVRLPTCPGWCKLDAPTMIVADSVDGFALIHRGHRTATSADPGPLLALVCAEAASPGYIALVALNRALDPETASLDPAARQAALDATAREIGLQRAAKAALTSEDARKARVKGVMNLSDLDFL
jgi:hypothetical protein